MAIASILLGAVLAMIVGTVWYSPLMFVKPWMQLSGISPQKMDDAKNSGMGKIYFAAFMNAIVLSGAIFYIQRLTLAGTFWKAIAIAFVLWLGFVATTLFSTVLWETKPIKLFAINAGQYLVSITLISLVHLAFGRF